MHSVIRIGSRESALAVRQAEIIRDLILESEPEAEIEIITMKTTGDKILDKSLEKIGGKGLFVKELDRGPERRPHLPERAYRTAGACGDRHLQQAPGAADGAALPGMYLPGDPGKCTDKDEKAGGGRI